MPGQRNANVLELLVGQSWARITARDGYVTAPKDSQDRRPSFSERSIQTKPGDQNQNEIVPGRGTAYTG